MKGCQTTSAWPRRRAGMHCGALTQDAIHFPPHPTSATKGMKGSFCCTTIHGEHEGAGQDGLLSWTLSEQALGGLSPASVVSWNLSIQEMKTPGASPRYTCGSPALEAGGPQGCLAALNLPSSQTAQGALLPKSLAQLCR